MPENNDVKNHTEINGVILSPQATETLQTMQQNANYCLNNKVNELSELVCYMHVIFAHEIAHDSDLLSQGMKHLGNLIDIREDLKSLAKP